jgi:adenosylcobyric acid synthase
MSKALLVAGTHSDAGKTVVTAGLCRWLVRQGVSVAPFKGQNMALNSAVTADGAEVGRAQAVQAAAARVEPMAAMNPVLLKPGSDHHSQVVVLGEPWQEVDALGYRALKPRLRSVVLDSLASLRSSYDVVVCEGAGSPAEINLRADDITNMGLARDAGLPVIVVGDIDRGGVFASLFGTLALLSAEDQALVAGFVINKFRGARALLEPGLAALQGLTGRPTLGVLPWAAGLRLDAEDSLDLEGPAAEVLPPVGAETLRVAVVRLPRMANATDLDPVAAEPGVAVRLVTRPEELADADLVVIPGSRATVDDLGWMRAQGLDGAVAKRAAEGRPVLGICAGYQILGSVIADDVESGAGLVDGLGLLPVRTDFGRDKLRRRVNGSFYGEPVTGYEIRHGRFTVDGGAAVLTHADGTPEGCRVGAVTGTSWHGVLDNDGFRRSYLAHVAAVSGRAWLPGSRPFASVREARLDLLGDLVADGLDTDAIWRLLDSGAPAGLPFVPPGAVL